MTKMNLVGQGVQKLEPEQPDTHTHRQTDKHTDRQTDTRDWKHYLPAFAVGKKFKNTKYATTCTYINLTKGLKNGDMLLLELIEIYWRLITEIC